jgi:hypothetical protein
MIDALTPSISPKRADLQTRQELLDTLGVPKGAATVARRSMPEGDLLMVRLTASSLLPPDQRPARFRGFPVTYEGVRPLKIRRV